jgi:hypothetical protein
MASQPAAPAATMVITLFLVRSSAEPASEAGASSHPFGDLEDKPAQGGEADTPEKHGGEQLSFPSFSTGNLRR